MKQTVLLIEDEGGIVDNISYALKTDGFNVLWCATGAEGLKAARAKDCAIIILDVGLPDINGFELFKSLRNITQVPILFLTARSEEIDRIVGLEMGADDYITKPFSPRELAARVKTVLRRVTRSGNSELDKPRSSLPFIIDDKKKSISYRDKLLQISRYEYRILAFLISHPGWVYTRAQLMQQIWDDPDMTEDRTVDAHIKNIRAKLKEIDPATDPIITHRGVGYSLKEDW